jgi:4-amino-4-deoxy-L-arabinose transferase-like glycosyltransferase
MPWFVMVVLGLIAFDLRAFRLGPSWDIFVDEITYLRLSQNVAHHLSVTLYGVHFYLHPPAFFFLQALYIRIVDPTGSVIEQVQNVRYLNALVASVSAALLFYIGYRLQGHLTGFIAALMFALDPFVIRVSSRNLLDPSAVMWVLFGYAMLFSIEDLKNNDVPWRRGIAAGLAFGMGLLTKDMIFFLTLVPLGVCFIRDWSLSRPLAFLVSAVTAAAYLPYLFTVVIIGDGRLFFDEKTRGALRLAGAIQETGFNKPGNQSFLSAVTAQLDTFATTYAILGLGLLAVGLLLLAGRPREQLVAVWTGSAYMLLAYSVAFGTLEEQFFYYLVVPSIVSIAVAGTMLYRERMIPQQYQRLCLGAGSFLILIFVAWSGAIWYRVHTTPDNGYQRVVTYLNENVPLGTHISVTTDTAQFIMAGYVSGVWVTPVQWRDHRVEYVVVSTSEINKGYSYAGQDTLKWLEGNAQLVYAFNGPTFGSMRVYRLPASFATAGSDSAVRGARAIAAPSTFSCAHRGPVEADASLEAITCLKSARLAYFPEKS